MQQNMLFLIDLKNVGNVMFTTAKFPKPTAFYTEKKTLSQESYCFNTINLNLPSLDEVF